MGDKSRGLYPEGKFIVHRRDGTDASGGKHDGCRYFVLDVTHDPHAQPALRAYAESARADGYGLLADDIERDFRSATEAKWLMDKMMIAPIIDGERFVLVDDDEPSTTTQQQEGE